MKVIAIIQARMRSTRLPGKVLMDLAGEPMLARVVNRAARARTLDEVVVATSTKPADGVLEAMCHQRSWPCHRGSETDVLDRYYQAALVHKAEAIARITSDCPLIDAGVVDGVVGEFLAAKPEIDFASNVSPRRTFPRGLDVEVVSFAALRQAWREATDSSSREHVTPYIQRHPEKFLMQSFTSDTDYSGMRWTVDTPEDLKFVRRIYDHFRHDGFTWLEVLEVLKANPRWLEINRHIVQKEVP
jgi:spore coat polysaccharide biosynthesis protein SpsF